MKCPIAGCGKEFQPYEGMRQDQRGLYWCEDCQDEFDSIDWDKVRESR